MYSCDRKLGQRSIVILVRSKYQEFEDGMSDSSTIYVDADACPVKDDVLKVAIRHEMPIYYVANAFMRLP